MPSNTSMDGQFDWLFAFLIQPFRWLAAHTLPASLATFVCAMELWAGFVYQFNRTVTAMIDSFHNERIYFYDDGALYYPIVITNRNRQRLFTGNHSWTYDVQKKQFIHEDYDGVTRTHRIPYLGASLLYTIPDVGTCRQVQVGDLSEWIGEQTIQSSTNELPLQVLVSAWAYCQQLSIVVGYKGYQLTVMNEDGDEVSYSLSVNVNVDADESKDETEYEDEIHSYSSSSSVSATEGEGEIQIIGEGVLPQSLYDLLVPTVPTNTPLPASPEAVSLASSSEDEDDAEDEPKKKK